MLKSNLDYVRLSDSSAVLCTDGLQTQSVAYRLGGIAGRPDLSTGLDYIYNENYHAILISRESACLLAGRLAALKSTTAKIPCQKCPYTEAVLLDQRILKMPDLHNI